MFNKPLSEINAEDLKNLIVSATTEGHSLEFKKEVWKRDDEGIREMLRDISSLANAHGGYLIVGMDEGESGEAASLIEVPNAEGERDRIFASCIANLDPRIIGLDIRCIDFDSGKKALLIKVPNGMNLHQVTFKGMYQFWKRHDRQKSKMTYHEIRDAIQTVDVSSDQISALLDKRKEVFRCSSKPQLIISAIPQKLESELFKITNSEIKEILKDHGAERQHGWNFNFMRGQTAKPTMNGLKISDNVSYVEAYRSGYVEACKEIVPDWGYQSKQVDIDGTNKVWKVLTEWALVESVYSFAKKVKALMDKLGHDYPMTFQLSLYHINHFVLPEYSSAVFSRSYACWREENLELAPVTFETSDPKVIAKELCDRLWQAFGFEHEPYFKNGDFDFR